jgi:hypothetical protein
MCREIQLDENSFITESHFQAAAVNQCMSQNIDFFNGIFKTPSEIRQDELLVTCISCHFAPHNPHYLEIEASYLILYMTVR